VYSAVAYDLGVSLKKCYRGMYVDLEDNKRLVQIGTRTADQYASDGNASTSTTTLTDSSDAEYEHTDLTVDWLLTRYHLALAQAVLYDATEMRVRVWDHFGTVFSYVMLFGLVHRIYPIDIDGERVPSTDQAAGHEAVLDGPASLFSKSQKYGIRMANFLPALPLCDRWEMVAEILVDETTEETRQLELDHTDGLDSHYSANDRFDSDVERTLARKWERANTEWVLVREDDVFYLGAEVMIPDFAIEHPDGRRAILEIVGFWTPEYLDTKLEKIREVEAGHLTLFWRVYCGCSLMNVGGRISTGFPDSSDLCSISRDTSRFNKSGRPHVADDSVYEGGVKQCDEKFQDVLADDQLHQDSAGQRLSDPKRSRNHEERQENEDCRVDQLAGSRRAKITQPQVFSVGPIADSVERDDVPVLTHNIGSQARCSYSSRGHSRTSQDRRPLGILVRR
jgi:predicted nuclease of restriction endonuclease-like RecB superfamily